MLAAAGVFVALGWLVLTAAIGWGASYAHATDDADAEGRGLLITVTGLVGGTVSAVTDVSTGAVQTATSTVVAPVVHSVTTLAPPTAPLTSVVTDTVQALTAPVRGLTDAGPVSGVVEPVVSIVGAVPIVGKLVSHLGVDQALTDVATTVDGTLTAVVGAVDDSVETIAPPHAAAPGATVPGAAPGHGTPIPALGDAVAVAPATAVAVDSAAPGRLDRLWPRTTMPSTGVSAAAPSGDTADGHSSPPGLCAPWGGSSLGSGATGPGAAALLAVSPFVAHRAWVRRRSGTDDDAPPTPTLDTDVSPD